MKITKIQLEQLIKETIQEETAPLIKEGELDIEHYQNAYVDMVREALETQVNHLIKKWPDLGDKSLVFTLSYIIGSYMFNHKRKLPGQFNPQNKYKGY